MENRILVIIPYHNEFHSLKRLLTSIADVADVVVVDSGVEKLDLEGVNTLKVPTWYFWTSMVNLGLIYARNRGYESICLINSDCEFVAFEDFVNLYNRSNVGILGSSVAFRDGTIKHTGINPKFESFGFNVVNSLPRELDECRSLGGQGVFIKLDYVDGLFFDDLFLPHYGSDFDFFGKIIKSGKKVHITKCFFVIDDPDSSGETSDTYLKKFRNLTSIRSHLNVKKTWINSKRHYRYPFLNFLNYYRSFFRK